MREDIIREERQEQAIIDEVGIWGLKALNCAECGKKLGKNPIRDDLGNCFCDSCFECLKGDLDG